METGAGTLGAPRSPGEQKGERGDQLQSRARCREGLFAQLGVRLESAGWKWRNRASPSFPLVIQQEKVASVPSTCTGINPEVGTRLPTWLEELGKLNQG